MSSRELLEVSSTTGWVVEVTRPSSGMEIWKSESTSRSIASNSWSVLSISSMSSTTGCSEAMADIKRSREQELLAEDVLLDGLPTGARGLGLDAQELLAVVPLIQRLGLIQALVALQANQLAAEKARERLGELGLADTRRSLHKHGLAELRREERDERGGVAREVADGAQALGDFGGGEGSLGGHRRGNDRGRGAVAFARSRCARDEYRQVCPVRRVGASRDLAREDIEDNAEVAMVDSDDDAEPGMGSTCLSPASGDHRAVLDVEVIIALVSVVASSSSCSSARPSRPRAPQR